MTKFRLWWAVIPIGFILLLGLLFVAPAPLPALADGGGCTDADAGSITGTGNLVTYSAPEGNTITGVCIKTGQLHTGALGNGTHQDGCYAVSGVGTGSVTVERVGEAGPECQEISHIDVYYEAEITPTPTDPPPTPTEPPPTPTEPPPTPTEPAGAVCVQVDAELDGDTMEVTFEGEGQGALAWRVIRVKDETVMAEGQGSSASGSFTGEYGVEYQLQFMGEDEEWTSEGCTFSFGRPSEPEKSCLTCGGPIQETMGESMGLAWFSDLPCDPNDPCAWFENNRSWLKLWTRIESFITHDGEHVALEEVTDANGDVCYVTFVRDGPGGSGTILWGPDGEGDRFRDHVLDSERALHKYSACSIFPSWCDTRLGDDGEGYAVWMPGHTTSDWAQFLLDNGFFPDEEYRGDAALEWAEALRENGNPALMTWDGDPNSLPLFPLPPR